MVLKKTVIMCIPKSGSGILQAQYGIQDDDHVTGKTVENCIVRSELKGLDVFWGHFIYSKEYEQWLRDNEYQIHFHYRDPRDVIVSYFRFMQRDDMSHIHESERDFAEMMFWFKEMEPWESVADTVTRFETIDKPTVPTSPRFRRGVVGSYKDEWIGDEWWEKYEAQIGVAKRWEWDPSTA